MMQIFTMASFYNVDFYNYHDNLFTINLRALKRARVAEGPGAKSIVEKCFENILTEYILQHESHTHEHENRFSTMNIQHCEQIMGPQTFCARSLKSCSGCRFAHITMCKNLQPELDPECAKTCSQSTICTQNVTFCQVWPRFGRFGHILAHFATFWHIFGTLRQPSEIVGRLVLSGDYKPTKTSRF